MSKLHTFGCSITQGFALPDVVKPIRDHKGDLLTDQQLIDLGVHWSDIHLYQPSDHAWPAVLARRLGIAVENHARRGACFNQIARQCAVAAPTIQPEDTVIVMWTYLSRLSLQWPARTAVPFCSVVDNSDWSFRTVVLGFNKFFGLERADHRTMDRDQRIQEFLQNSSTKTYLDPLHIYDRYYNSLVLQTMTAGFLERTGARVIHLSVESLRYLDQLEEARSQLDDAVREPYVIPDPSSWYTLEVDHDLCPVIMDPTIPPAENDMHPSVQHHLNFADAVYDRYFL